MLVEKLEKKKYKTTSKPRTMPPADAPAGERYIPDAVKREVAARDGGQCTFVGPDGHRCSERSCLEFDHIEPVAKGGRSTVKNVRLRCHAHNQHAADQVFGRRFMEDKRRGRSTTRQRAALRSVGPGQPPDGGASTGARIR